ncbi:MAG: hypothetical protein HRT45_17965 [Bdellovibrionales bacterium]|nr:hypothetical protein [Bdellovibrionales bacterium]
MERVVYELKPYICLGLAIWVLQQDYVMVSNVAGLAKLSTFVLISMASTIIWMCTSYRGYIGPSLKDQRRR